MATLTLVVSPSKCCGVFCAILKMCSLCVFLPKLDVIECLQARHAMVGVEDMMQALRRTAEVKVSIIVGAYDMLHDRHRCGIFWVRADVDNKMEAFLSKLGQSWKRDHLGCLDQEKELAEADEAVLRAVVFQVNTYTAAKSQSMLVNLGQPCLWKFFYGYIVNHV
jgi:hypothetical protein